MNKFAIGAIWTKTERVVGADLLAALLLLWTVPKAGTAHIGTLAERKLA